MDATQDIWLILEDGEDERFLFQRACCQAFEPKPVVRFERDANAAKTYLLAKGSPPNLILADVVLTRTGGLHLLNWMREQPQLAAVPFMVVSGSAYPRDRERARRNGANGYYVKPSTLGELIRLVQEIHQDRLSCLTRRLWDAEARVLRQSELLRTLVSAGRDPGLGRSLLDHMTAALDAMRKLHEVFSQIRTL